MKCQQKLTAAWCFLWSVKSIAVPHRQSCCLACSHIVGLQTRLIANKVPCFQATYLPELNTSAAFVQPYLSSSVAGIRSAEMERGCHCIFGLNTTHLHGTLTAPSCSFCPFFSHLIAKNLSFHFCEKSPLQALLIKHQSSRWHFPEESCCTECSCTLVHLCGARSDLWAWSLPHPALSCWRVT